MTRWTAPALGVVMTRIATLALRAERLRAATQAQGSERVLDLLSRKPEQ